MIILQFNAPEGSCTLAWRRMEQCLYRKRDLRVECRARQRAMSSLFLATNGNRDPRTAAARKLPSRKWQHPQHQKKPEGSGGPWVGSLRVLRLSRHRLTWPYTASGSETHTAITCLIRFNGKRVKLKSLESVESSESFTGVISLLQAHETVEHVHGKGWKMSVVKVTQ